MSEEQPPFKLSPQVGILVAIALLALVIPGVAIGYYFRTPQQPTPARVEAADPAASAPLQISLESIANQAFAETTSELDPTRTIVLEAADVPDKVEHFLGAARQAGATVIETSDESEPVRRWTAMVPSDRSAIFLEKVTGQTPASETTGGAGDSAIFVVEIHPKPIARQPAP